MENFIWELPLSNNVTATTGSVIPVIINGKNVGTCIISSLKGKLLGNFSLIIDLPKEEDGYLLEPSSIINENGINILSRIYILPPSTSKLVAL